MPLGGSPMPGWSGSWAWHMLQWLITMALTSAKVTGSAGAAAARSASEGPAMLSRTMAIMPTTATAQVHQGDGRPLWRQL